MSTWLAIVNPRSGSANTRRTRSVLGNLRHTHEVRFTEYPGHATDLARGAGAYVGLTVVGGDGTISEVLQGMDRRRQTLAVVPAGRGNSLARDLGLYPYSAAREHGSLSRIDLVEVLFQDGGGIHKVLAASTIAVGYAAELAALANLRFRRSGRFCYVRAGACLAPMFRAVSVSYDGDGAFMEKRITGIVASNTRHAANFVAFPTARCNDGTFEAMELATGYFGQSLHNLSSLSPVPFHGPPAREKLTKLRAVWQDPAKLLIDGEIYSNVVSMELGVVPGAVSCLINRGIR